MLVNKKMVDEFYIDMFKSLSLVFEKHGMVLTDQTQFITAFNLIQAVLICRLTPDPSERQEILLANFDLVHDCSQYGEFDHIQKIAAMLTGNLRNDNLNYRRSEFCDKNTEFR